VLSGCCRPDRRSFNAVATAVVAAASPVLPPPPQIWITNEHQHSGLRDDGAAILEKLLGMTRGEVNLPS
jgi:hypothetical protein